VGFGLAQVVVFEDEPNIRKLLSVLFQDYDVVFRPDGASAIEVLERERPAVVILDLKLPKVSGVDILREVRGHPDFASILVVIISGSIELLGSPRTDRKTVLLRKPFDIFELKAIVDQHLQPALA
jgi:DNA-binding response OmpR family regulator